MTTDTAGSSTKPPQLRSIIDSWFQVLAQHPDQWRLLTSANSADPAVRAAVQRVTDMQLRNDVMLINAFVPNLPTAEVAPLAHALRGSLIAIGTWWLDNPTVNRSVPVDAMTRLCAGLFASPLQRQRKQVPSVVTDN